MATAIATATWTATAGGGLGRGGGGRSGGGGRGGGDSRVTSGRQARSAESVAPIPGMVDDNIQGRRL